MAVDIRPTSILEMELQPGIHDMLEEYAAESAIKGLPHPAAKAATYKNLEALGTLFCFGAFEMDDLIGYIQVMLPVLPHFDLMVAVTESFFVLKDYRKTGAGLKLLRVAERFVEEKGSPGLLVSAPLFGDLCEVLPMVGYQPTSCVWFKNFASSAPRLPRMKAEDIAKVSAFEAEAMKQPQVALVTEQTLHAGMYSRTVKIPAGVRITGALIRVPTLVIVNGDATVYAGEEFLRLNGHAVLNADAGRKQIFEAHSDTYLTMIFATAALTVEEAEEEFTDEVDLLQTRQGLLNFSSGEQPCLASQQQPSSLV